MDETSVRIDMADVAAYIKMNHPDVWAEALAAVLENTRLIAEKVQMPPPPSSNSTAKKAK